MGDFLRRVLGGLVLLFAVGRLSAQSVTGSATADGAIANITMTYNPSSHNVSYSGQLKGALLNGGAEGRQAGYMATLHNTNGGDAIGFLSNRVCTASQDLTVADSDAVGSVPSGKWVRIYVFTETNSGDWTAYEQKWMQAGVVDQYKANITVPGNDTDRSIRYDVVQNGNVVWSLTQAPGAGPVIQSVTLPTGDPYYVYGYGIGFTTTGSGGNTSYTDTGVPTDSAKMYDSGAKTPSLGDSGGDNFNIPRIDMPNTSAIRPPGTIWDKSTDGNNGSPDPSVVQKDLLTNATFRQGVDKIADKVDALRADEKKRDDDRKAAEKSVKDAIPPTSEMQGKASQAAQEIASKFPDVAQPAAVTVAKEAPTFTVQFPQKFGGGVFDLDPFRDDRCGPVVDWFRVAVKWLTVVLFGYWASKQVSEWSRGISTVQQAKGNTFAGSGAQITALIAAGLMTAAVVTFVVALLGWLGGDFAITHAVAIVVENPLDTMPGKVAWILDRIFPVATILGALGARLTWNLYAAKIYAVLVATVRFIVP